jgi:lipocalin
MANTFSQSLTGVSANYRYNTPKEITVNDLDIAGNAVAQGNASAVGAQQGAMMRNDYVLTKGPDGLLSYHVIDAERSILPGYIVLRKV